MNINLSVISRLNDARLADVFHIWENAFPPEEKNPPVFWLQYFAAWYHPEDGGVGRHKELIAFHEEKPGSRSETVGMALLEVTHSSSGEKVGFLRYLAVDESRRGMRVGSRAFTALQERAFGRFDCSVLVWEVEPPDRDDTALRRYHWYQRMGGRQVLGIEHSIQMPGQARTKLWVMVSSPMDGECQNIYDAVCTALETEVSITGAITLEESNPSVRNDGVAATP